MRMTIEKMSLENFKGCRQLEIIFNADKTEIKGANGTGKTTIADAFSWLMFNKDSHGNAPGSDNFHEKPLDENGNEKHNLDTTVAIDCMLDGHRFDLKRTQSENWVKKRGNAEATFQGNVSTYWINGVETKLSDFKQRIAAIADEEVFRLVGSLSAFNQLEWKKRRAQLLTLSGEDVDGELLSRSEYRALADEVGQRGVSVDELKKVLNDQRKKLNDELKMLPVRIDEAKKSLPALTAQQIKDAEYIVKDTKETMETVRSALAELKAGNSDAPSRQHILALEQELVSLKRQMWSELAASSRNAKAAEEAATAKLKTYSDQLSRGRVFEQTYQEKVNRAVKQVEELRDKFKAVRDEKVDVGSTICPTCGQPMPGAMIEQIKAKADADRKERLNEIRRRGTEAAQAEREAREALSEQSATNAETERLMREAQEERTRLMAECKAVPSEPDFTSEPRYAELVKEIADAKAEQSGVSEDEKIVQYDKRLNQLQETLDRAQATLAQRDSGRETEQRIKMHEARQQEVGAQLSETENLIILLERFVTDRCGALEDSINSHFPTLRWKLFDTQINGGIVDCCECMIPCDGSLVSYSSANTAAQINADVEIVNVLSEHYDVEVPLFVDNKERVNVLADTDSQLITLSVSADSELTIE